MSRIRVARFESPAQAEPIKERLNQFGISATVHNESGVAKFWYVSKKSAGIRIEVPARDAERARRLILAWDDECGCLAGAVRCPECRSTRIDYPQFTQKSFLTNVTMGLAAELGLIERQYYCEDCHCMWAKPDSRPHPVRHHLAPDYFLERLPHDASPSRGKLAERGPLKLRRRHGCSRTRLGIRFGWRWQRVGFGAIIIILASHVKLPAAQLPAAGPPSQPVSAHAENPTYLRDVLPILMGKCTRCHNDQNHVMQNWMDYHSASAERWEIKRRVWDSWKGAYFKQPMPTVNSPEHGAITDEERAIIRNWVESGAPCGVQPSFNSSQSKAERMEMGKRLFTVVCATCHQPTGQGIPGRFPPLAGSDFLNSDKHRAIKIVVNGFQGEVTVNGQKFNNSMPKFPLSDVDIACALTFVYNSFGNSGKDVTPQEVSSVRAEKNDLNVGAKPPEEKSPYE